MRFRGACMQQDSSLAGLRCAAPVRFVRKRVKARAEKKSAESKAPFGARRAKAKTSRSIEPQTLAPTPQSTFHQRSLFAGAVALLVGVTAVALWSSQHWSLPWHRRRRKIPEAVHAAQAAVRVTPDTTDLAEIVDDQPLCTPEEEVARLQAARTALAQRLHEISGGSNGARSLPPPFTPLDDRPWRSAPAAGERREAVSVGPAALDASADVSAEEQQDGPALSSSSISTATESAPPSSTSAVASQEALPGLTGAASTEEETVWVKPSDRRWREAEPPEREPGGGGTSEATGMEEDISGNGKRETDAAPSSNGATAAEPAAPTLPNSLTQEAQRKAEGTVLPTPSVTDFTQQTIATEEAEAVLSAVAPVDAATGYIRRSQKPVPRVEGQLRLVAAGASIAAPAKSAVGKGGEDAYFVSAALWGAVGVADGVGSWSADGIDPSLYSRRLLEVASAATEHGWGRRKGQGARGLMHIAQTGTMDVAGTSTVCIAQMMLGPALQIANLGDSGFRIFREGRCLFGSEVQQHSFNCPYQAGSPKLHPKCNTANDAEVYELGLRAGDVVLLATDGVFDNLWDRDLETLIRSYHEARGGRALDAEDAEALAGLVVQAANQRGGDARARTPWIVEAAAKQPGLLPWHLRLRPRGGKPDDCTAVVAVMHPDSRQH